jgi:spore germination protein YaaH/CHASE3 domain sensor protein
MDLKSQDVKKLTKNALSYFGIRVTVLLVIVGLFFQGEAYCQTQNNPAVAKSDTATRPMPSSIKLIPPSEFKKKPKGLIKNIVQPIKFRENRDYRAKDSIYSFIHKLIDRGQLQIDPKTVDQIMQQLDQIASDNNSNTKRLDGNVKINKAASLDNQQKIQHLLDTFKIQDKVNAAIFDSLKTQMSAFIQVFRIKNSEEKKVVLSEIDDALKEIGEVKYSTASKLAPTESDTINGNLTYFKRSLKPKIEIIGWQSSGKNDYFRKYNYNYLSAINLDHFELSENGNCKNSDDIKEFQKPGGIITVAQSKGCDVHLTVHSNNDIEIRNFLRNSEAQESFFSEIDSIVVQSKIKGINIFFDCVMSPDPLVRFMAGLRSNLKSINPKIQLNVTIPAIVNNENKFKVESYKFPALNPLVDHYLVLTDNLIPRQVDFAQTASPLYKSDRFRNRTIESTFSYYKNTEIPNSKLIMTVSYSGNVWAVSGFTGKLVQDEPETLGYADILENYLNQQYESQGMEELFDPEQGAPFLNVIAPDSSLLEQIWFEDTRSLYLKYQWALDNNLGGVSIRYLGSDRDYPDLWEAIGASLIKIDTSYIDDQNHKKSQMNRIWTIIMNTYKGFKLSTFRQDMKWARAVRLKYISEDTISGHKRFDYELNHSIGSVDDSIAKYVVKESIWDETIPYVPELKKSRECYLPNLSYCYSLYARWAIYAQFFKWCFYMLLSLTLLFAIISFNLQRYLRGGEKMRNFIRNVPALLGFFSILLFGSWLFIDPSIKWFGTGSAGGTDSIIMIYTLISGIVFGWFFTYNYYKYKRL